jgi:hypothetical protein
MTAKSPNLPRTASKNEVAIFHFTDVKIYGWLTQILERLSNGFSGLAGVRRRFNSALTHSGSDGATCSQLRN